LKEPKARNTNGAPKWFWKRLNEEEKHFYNKVFAYMYFHREQFTDVGMTSDEWRSFCEAASLFSTSTYQRTRQAEFKWF
jgi:hypothetical protein